MNNSPDTGPSPDNDGSLLDCKHESQIPTKKTKSNGVVVVCLQCTKCWRSIREVTKANYDLTKLPEFSIQKREEAREQKQDLFKQQSEERSLQWWSKYNAYLLTDNWRNVRSTVLNRDRICQVCFEAHAAQAHHISYRSFNLFGISFPVECVGICIACHESIHDDGGIQ